jgi:colicin import membrane protein
MLNQRSVRIFGAGGNSSGDLPMRNTMWVAAVALCFGCAMFGGGSDNAKKSETRTQQDQAHQSLQSAADAQKKASEEQAKVEQFQQNVTQKQKELADAQAQLRGQISKAEQAQRDAQQATKTAQTEASQQQTQAMQTQRSESQRMQSSVQQNQQSWTQQQSARGTVVQAGSDELQIRTQDKDLLQLQITDSTAVTFNGQTASASQLQPGSDVRASYQMVDGKAKALKIDATSKGSSSQPDQQK